MINVRVTIPFECTNCHHTVEAEAEPVGAREHTLEVKARCPRCRTDCIAEVPPDQWLKATIKTSTPLPITPAQRSFLAMVRSVVSGEHEGLDGLPPLMAAASAFQTWIASLPQEKVRAYPTLTQVAATLQRNPAAGLLETLPAALGLEPDAEWASEDIEAARCALINVANNTGQRHS